ncbi:conjugative relaxase domain-containing protein, TrwC/TraI family [Prosthecobacter debontii]|uniref:Conjugative relaxase domain-containing protein, TrwC/TraI family n=2 Tax=Prosthecobacter debontii TaxID=48467 RepID=A0A1T4YJA5_9BACT|nr:conjugative relaxase domain-containing protein, TrwC/TraI family [Prosthecobacter debontii]
MLRVVAHGSAAAARQYYTEGLKKEDYYSEGQEIAGKWHGEAARLLGLEGDVTPEAFAALVENQHPVTGERLTQRTRANRRVGYDLNFHAPKSLSVLYALTQNPEILTTFRKAVADTMTDLEQYAETRVRKRGAQTNRPTGNLAWAEFIHFTSRPVEGIPDPHLHAHCFAFNATFDPIEDKWKAAEFAAIKREAHCAEAAFHTRLAAGISELDYSIERTKTGWEIAGMPKTVIAKFSRRTALIEKKAEEMGITDAKAKDALGAATREGKRHGATFSDLLAAWGQRLTAEEKVILSKACFDRTVTALKQVTAAEAMDFAIAKMFERQSVVERGHILAAALRYGTGVLTPESVRDEFQRRQFIGRKVGDQHLCTLMDVLAEEVALLAFVRGGRNSAAPLGGSRTPAISSKLSEEQQAAVKHILTSRDQVIAIKGGAGVGKTTLMQEACKTIESQGVKLFAFAPSAVASRETLREGGFAGADTVAQLLVNPSLQKQVRGQVIWIDEAGLLGVRDLWRIMEIAGSTSRIILTGDTAQHTPVARGDAFRILQKYAGLRIAEVSQIRRQQIEDYKQAIAALSKGDLRTGFRRLEALGAFVEIEDDAERYRQLALDYLALGKGGRFPLVVSPTHAESALVTQAIREARREAGQLQGERVFTQYRNLQWEEAERGFAQNYQPGMVVQFHQNGKGIKRGEIFRVQEVADGQVKMTAASGRSVDLPLKECGKFLVYEEMEIRLAKGDRIRITRNGFSENGRRLNNGNTAVVEKFGKKGEIILTGGVVLNPHHGHFAYGYCQTSHSSQSLSIRDVLVAQSKNSLVASSQEQFYVSCSRGKQTLRIYTDDRELLREAVGHSSTRLAGMELAGLTQKDLSTFMATELGAKQWREAIASRRGLDGDKDFVKQLSEHRKVEPRQAGEIISWKGYVEMKRGIAGPDGKSRSKGYNSQPSKGGEQKKGRSWPKTVEHTDGFLKRNEAAAARNKAETQEKPKTEAKPREGRLAKAYRSSAENFKKLADKVKGTAQKTREIRMGGTKVKPGGQNSFDRSAKHAAKGKTAAAHKTQKPPVKTRQASPPVVRK